MTMKDVLDLRQGLMLHGAREVPLPPTFQLDLEMVAAKCEEYWKPYRKVFQTLVLKHAVEDPETKKIVVPDGTQRDVDFQAEHEPILEKEIDWTPPVLITRALMGRLEAESKERKESRAWFTGQELRLMHAIVEASKKE